MNQKIIFLCIMFISGCCSYEKKDFDFSAQELSHFSNYKIGDTIYFQSNQGDVDTITIVDIQAERNEHCGVFLAPKAFNSQWIQIKHLPIDRWYGTSQDMTTDRAIKIIHQELFGITKNPGDKKTEYDINFKDFYSSSDLPMGEYHVDTIDLNNLKFSNYYRVEHKYPERIVDAKNTKTMYWTDQYGLTAYANKAGETWTIKRMN